jgi:hypothetical protein
VLHEVSILGRISSPNQFFLILNTILRAIEQELSD